jgi:hypothetical protein
MSLPDAEAHIKEILGTHYVDGDWRPALKAVMDMEGDSNVAISAVEQLKKAASHQTGLKIQIPTCQPFLAQLTALEDEVTTSLHDLMACNRIFGTPLSMDKFLEPAEEQEVGDCVFEGGDKEIVAAVGWEMAGKWGEVIEVESNEEEDIKPAISHTKTLALCQQLERACLQFGNADLTLLFELLKQIHLFHAELRHEELLHLTQTIIDAYFH